MFQKPFVLEEYGKVRSVDGPCGRNSYYQRWFEIVYGAALANGAGAGLHFWMFGADNSGHDDGFVVFCQDVSTVRLLQQQTYAIWRLVAPQITTMAVTGALVDLSWSESVGSPEYRILASENLSDWTTRAVVQTNRWKDVESGASVRRFYRIRPHY
ncbi:MAG: hypothetical protein N2255_00315 [Kiritimatiellae bacterium]|nr:hypothetical protein [Kiritimatiellia bacterium]